MSQVVVALVRVVVAVVVVVGKGYNYTQLFLVFPRFCVQTVVRQKHRVKVSQIAP